MILLLTLIIGAGLLVIQLHLLSNLETSLRRTFHRDCQLEFESFNYDFLDFKATFKKLRIGKGSESLQIDELTFYFNQEDFSKMNFVIEEVSFSELKFNVDKAEKVMLTGLLSHDFERYKNTDKLQFRKVMIQGISLKLENFMRTSRSKLTSIILKNFDLPMSQFNGSMDISASVLYFSLQTAIGRVQSEFNSRFKQTSKSSRKK